MTEISLFCYVHSMLLISAVTRPLRVKEDLNGNCTIDKRTVTLLTLLMAVKYGLVDYNRHT